MQAYTRKYQYDKMGNVLQVKQQGSNGFTRKFGYFTDVNTLEKISDNSDALIEDFTYDACGNQLTAGASRHYIWTAANRLLVYKNQTGSSDPTIFAQYDYDGAGNRTLKLVRTGTAGNPVYARTIYIDSIFEYHILENGTTYEKNYVHIMDASAGSAQASRIAMVRVGDAFPDDITESITYHLENQIKSSSARLDTNGTVIDREEYYPFGDSSLRTFSKKRYRYVGKEKDLESGLYYYGARYYSAWCCRFVSVDPLVSEFAHLSPFIYASNSPITSIDIDGQENPEESKSPGGGNNKDIQHASLGGVSGMIDTDKGIKAGKYILHGMKTASGEQKWVAREYKDDGTFSDEWVIGSGSFKEFYNNVGSYEYSANVFDWGIAMGGKPGQSIGESWLKIVKNPMNWLAGMTMTGAMLRPTNVLNVPRNNMSFNSIAGKITNPVPPRLARVVPSHVNSTTLGPPGALDVFVTAADDLAGLNASQIATRLTIPKSSSGFKIIEFNTPSIGLSSPINRMNPGFVGFGRTAGGAREFTLPNQNIPIDATPKYIQ